MTMLIRGAAMADADLRRGSLVDLADTQPTAVAGLDLAPNQRAAASLLDLDNYAGPGTFCELQLSDGNCVWLRPDELASSPYFELATSRGDVELVPRRSSERGLGDLAVRLLKVFKVDPIEVAAKLTRGALLSHIERNIDAGLFQLAIGSNASAPFQLAPLEAKLIAGGKPCLLMLHGTISSTFGSFGGLAASNGGDSWQRLSQTFGQRMLALEHRTLSVSPLDNALELANLLPGGLRLHLLSHSRGGLIGELLARRNGNLAGFAPQELAQLDALDPTLAGRVRELDKVLRDKAFIVERFVRVACPARGTTGVSERGRKWLTVFVNLMARLLETGTTAALGATGLIALKPIAQRAVELLKALTLETIEFSQIPGLYAMDPASSFIRALINSEHARGADSLAVVAGDTEGSGVFGRLKMFAVDTFNERENDLVVDTDSMVGGAQRSETFRLLARGDDISHFRYFSGARTSEVISKALTAADLKTVDALIPFAINQGQLRAPLRTPPLRSGGRDLPIVFLLPGIMGTQLNVDSDAVWADHWALVRGGFARLGASATGVSLGALDGETYQSIADALAADHEVVPFPYDWRLPIEDAAHRLDEAVRARLADAVALKRPIRFVAHSMGGLVVRAMMLLKDSVWRELETLPDRRFVMLGTPNQGSHAISLLLTGNDKLVRMLALVDLRNSIQDIVGIAAHFPGALDMAPVSGERDYFSEQAWADLASAKQNPPGWPLPPKVELERSRAFRQRLSAQDLSGLDIYYIAGQANDTPVRADLDVVRGRTRLTFIATREGDGRVPWASGIPVGVKAWYVPAKHGSIPAYRPLHEGLRDILASGSTTRLSATPPRTRDLPGALHPYPEPRINFLPAEGDLIAAALDIEAAPEVSQPEPLPDIDVQVIWGNLHYAKDPVVVGHYVGDLIVSAEAALDRFLHQALSRRLALGRYPGEIGTALVIPNAHGMQDALPGAVVIGLGQVSTRLTRSDLTRAVQAGVSEWAARMLESKPTNGEAQQPSSRGLAFVAVGSGQGGMALTDVGSAILEGVHRALSLLQSQRSSAEVHALRLKRIQFLELYEDRAHTLWYGLTGRQAGVGGDSALAACFKLDASAHGVGIGEGGRRRLVLSETDDWWSPLKITQQGSQLLFENIGDRARAELRGVGTHASQIDDLLSHAISGRDTDHRLCRALFAMMIPNDLKDSLPTGERMRLLVDPVTARYPWELILAGQSAPAGARDAPDSNAGNGVVRQFVTARFRANPRMARAANALVVGDPITNGIFPPLPGALEEAQSVHATLTDLRFDVPDQVLRDARSILIELHAQAYQIVHLAGHGIEDLHIWLSIECEKLSDSIDTSNAASADERPADLAKLAKLAKLRLARDELKEEEGPVSAMVIGPHQFLTYRNIEQMSDVPELVFVNCCHLGRISGVVANPLGRPSAIAAGFAEKFIEIGVRAVVAAGWPVDDAAAGTFANTFYRSLRRGETFGEAVREARAETRKQHPDSNTWAAYQCYGDPSFRPTASGGQTSGWQGNEERYGSPRHLAYEGIPGVNSIEQLRSQADYAIQQGFDKDGELCSEIADAYRDKHDFTQAIVWYRKALAAEKAGMPLRSIERLLNLVVRSEQVVASKENKPSRDWLRHVDEAIALLERVNQEAPSQERLYLIGSANKRKAMALTGPRRLKALQASAAAYSAAAKMAEHGDNPYPFINAAVMFGAVAWAQVTKIKLPTPEIKSLLKEAEERIAQKRGSDFSHFAAPGDLIVARIFVADLAPTEANAQEALSHFTAAFQRDRKKGNLASVVDQLRVMRTVVAFASNGKSESKTGAQLRWLLNELSKLMH